MQTHSDDKVKQMWTLRAHVARPEPQLSLTTLTRARRVRPKATAVERVNACGRGRPSADDGDEELGVVSLDASGVEPFGSPQLGVDIAVESQTQDVSLVARHRTSEM